MTTKSLTQNRAHRTHNQIDRDIGRHDIPDVHPLITCTPHVMEGRAHVTATKVTVERILHGLMHERGHAELVLPNGEKVPSSDVRAAVRYVVDVFVNISKVYAELARLQAGPAEKKTKT